MRRTALIVCSTIHLPVSERRHIDALIATAPRGADGRVEVGHPDLVIEPYAYGFFVHTCLVGWGSERPDDISVEFWAILTRAFDSDVSWVLFDRDEPPSRPICLSFPTPNDPRSMRHDRRRPDRRHLAKKRSALASYANAYAVAVQLRRVTGRPQYVLRTGNPLRPFQVTSTGPTRRQALLTLIA